MPSENTMPRASRRATQQSLPEDDYSTNFDALLQQARQQVAEAPLLERAG
jgi:hypothetical protein